MDFLAMETAILDGIQRIHVPVLDQIMMGFSKLGDAGLLWIAVGVLLLCTKKYRKGGILVLVSLLLQVTVGNLLIKNLVARPRPCWVEDGFALLIPIPKDYSFPSGHTMSSFAAATALFYANKKFGIIAYIVATCIAFSRLYLYVHYPTDVLAGLALGILVAWIAYKIVEWMSSMAAEYKKVDR